MIALVCGFLFLSALVLLVALFWVSFKVWEMNGVHISQFSPEVQCQDKTMLFIV